jgi:hypothetical protein
MPETTLEIRVSLRELDRPRLIEAFARDATGVPLEGLAIRLEIDANGTFEEDVEVKHQEVVTKANGLAYFQWWEYPRTGPRRDFTSTIRATWHSDANVYLQDTYE